MASPTTSLDVEVKIPIKEFQKLFEMTPDIAFFHLRDTMGAVFGSFRRTHLQRTLVKNARRFTFYRIRPLTDRGKIRNGRPLSAIMGESLSSSKAALGLEVGGTVRPKKGRFLAIPMNTLRTSTGRIKKSGKSPARYAAGKRRKELVVLPANAGQFPPNPSDTGLVLFHRIGKGKRQRLKPVFRLVRKIETKPLFKFIETWDGMKDDRNQRWARALERIVADMAKDKVPK